MVWSAGVQHGDPGLKFQRAFDATRFAVYAGHHQRIGHSAAVTVAFCGVFRCASLEGDLSGPVGGEMNNDDLIGGAGEHFTFEVDAIDGVTHAGHGGVQIEIAAVIRGRGRLRAIQIQITQSFIRHFTGGHGHHIAADDFRGGIIFSIKNELAYLGQCGEGVRIIWIVRAARPERVFIDLEMFLPRAAKNHRTEPAVADGQRLGPFGRRLLVPERERRSRILRLGREENKKCRQGDDERAWKCLHQQILSGEPSGSKPNMVVQYAIKLNGPPVARRNFAHRARLIYA